MKNIYILLVTLFCTNLLSAQCFDDGHSPFENQGWLSCQESLNPIPERGTNHWLLYDLGHIYTIDETYFWNHNVWGETGMGVNQILIDYSTDKQNWKTIGPYTIDKAPGSWKYTGIEGPTLGNVTGRYFLITVLSTHDPSTTCAGLGEIRFSIGESVSTDEIIEEEEFTISPNPASSIIRLSVSEVENIQRISIYNTVGQLMQDLNIPTGNEYLLPVDQYEPGLYHVSLWTDKGVKTKSFIKVE